MKKKPAPKKIIEKFIKDKKINKKLNKKDADDMAEALTEFYKWMESNKY